MLNSIKLNYTKHNQTKPNLVPFCHSIPSFHVTESNSWKISRQEFSWSISSWVGIFVHVIVGIIYRLWIIHYNKTYVTPVQKCCFDRHTTPYVFVSWGSLLVVCWGSLWMRDCSRATHLRHHCWHGFDKLGLIGLWQLGVEAGVHVLLPTLSILVLNTERQTTPF